MVTICNKPAGFGSRFGAENRHRFAADARHGFKGFTMSRYSTLPLFSDRF
jgi:hypothetical protein